LAGTAHKFGDDVNTDYIISSRRRIKAENVREMVPYAFEDIDPEFASRVEPGDFVVAGSNFGCGSSRETAPLVIQVAGVAAVLAKSYARIFFRNTVGIGLPAVMCDTDRIAEGDALEVDLDANVVHNRTRQEDIPIQPIPPFMKRILNDGGLRAHFRKYGTFNVG
jgi:3-isopropylmalate/(R)-2-methylmalate dehydratase small subunit